MTDSVILPRTESYFCSQTSDKIGEELQGTAPHVTTWLLLEYTGSWSASAFEDSKIPDSVKQHINAYLRETPNHKLLLIKRKTKKSEAIRFYFGQVGEDQKLRLYESDLDGYENLLSYDFNNPKGNRVADPFLLVCTNGKKDECCAKFGFPLYQALTASSGLDVWEASHVGQHRFAPNILAFPQGVYYGRVTEADIPELINQVKQNGLLLSRLRGCTTLSGPAQAAAQFLRTALAYTSFDGLKMLSASQQQPKQWQVIFEKSGDEHVVTIEHHPGKQKIYASCVGNKVIDISSYKLLSIES